MCKTCVSSRGSWVLWVCTQRFSPCTYSEHYEKTEWQRLGFEPQGRHGIPHFVLNIRPNADGLVQKNLFCCTDCRMSSICLVFCWSHLYRISDLFISQIAPLYCSGGFPLSFLLAFELNFPYIIYHHFFCLTKDWHKLSRTHHSFPSTIPSELSLSFPSTIPDELPQDFFYQVCCDSSDCMDWIGSGPQVSNNM